VIRARFDAAVTRMEELGLLDASAPRGRHALRVEAASGKSAWDEVSRRYFEARIPCPFLEDERCSVYEHRPMVCREYRVSTPPEWCETLDERRIAIERPVHMGEALATATSAILGLEPRSIPLALVLEWIEVHGAELEAVGDGETMFWALVKAVTGEDA
jgi:Fe-S-cluster containining protein